MSKSHNTSQLTNKGLVSTKESQEFTELEKEQARNNIGAANKDDTLNSVGISMPAGFDVSNSPLTDNGVISVTYESGFTGYTIVEKNKLSTLQDRSNHTGTQDINTINGLETRLSNHETAFDSIENNAIFSIPQTLTPAQQTQTRSNIKAVASNETLPETIIPKRIGTIASVEHTNANLIVNQGVYYLTSSAQNLPIASDGYVNCFAKSNTEIKQVFYMKDSNRVFMRNLVTGVWQAWEEISSNYTVLGTLPDAQTPERLKEFNVNSTANDLNLMNKSGFYYASGTAANIPVTSTIGFVFVMAQTNQLIKQVWYEREGYRIYTRHCTLGTWSPWLQTPTEADIETVVNALPVSGSALNETNDRFLIHNTVDRKIRKFAPSRIKDWIKSWITKADVGLDKVANKSEADMVASGAIKDALESKTIGIFASEVGFGENNKGWPFIRHNDGTYVNVAPRNLVDGKVSGDDCNWAGFASQNVQSPYFRHASSNAVVFLARGDKVIGGPGAGYDWHDMTSQRAAGTAYFNNTGRPIMVNISQNKGGDTLVRLYVNWKEVGHHYDWENSGGRGGTVSAIVPVDAEYHFEWTAGGGQRIMEMR